MLRKSSFGLPLILAILATLALSACGDATPTSAPAPKTSAAATTAATSATNAAPATASGQEVVIYSARKEELMKPITDAFTKKTGTKVILKSGSPGELALLIEQEKSSPRGDVYFTTDVATAENLGQKGLLDSYIAPASEKLPTEFKSAQGHWVGVIGRSRNIMYNTNLVKAEDAPKSVFELTEPKWKGKFALASIKEGGVRLWLDSLMLLKGEEFTTKFINDLKANGMKVLANHTEVAKAVARGEVALGLVNHYYYVPEKKAGQPVGVAYPDQEANQIGTLVIPLSASVIKGAKNPAAAKSFIDFLLSAEGQDAMTGMQGEFPLIPGVDLGTAKVEGIKPLSEVKRPTLDVTKLASYEKQVVEIFTPLLSVGS